MGCLVSRFDYLRTLQLRRMQEELLTAQHTTQLSHDAVQRQLTALTSDVREVLRLRRAELTRPGSAAQTTVLAKITEIQEKKRMQTNLQRQAMNLQSAIHTVQSQLSGTHAVDALHKAKDTFDRLGINSDSLAAQSEEDESMLGALQDISQQTLKPGAIMNIGGDSQSILQQLLLNPDSLLGGLAVVEEEAADAGAEHAADVELELAPAPPSAMEDDDGVVEFDTKESARGSGGNGRRGPPPAAGLALAAAKAPPSRARAKHTTDPDEAALLGMVMH